MAENEFGQLDKKVLQMTRDGLTRENVSTGETENISHKKVDCEYHKQDSIENAYNNGVGKSGYPESAKHLSADSRHSKVSATDVEEIELDETESSSTYTPMKDQKFPQKSMDHVKENVSDTIDSFRTAKNYRYERRQDKRELGRKKQNKDSFDRETNADRDYFKDDKFKKFNKKIEKADKKVKKRYDELYARRLKFNKAIGRLKFEKGSEKVGEKFSSGKLSGKGKLSAKRLWNSWSESRRQNRDMMPATMFSEFRKADRHVRNVQRKWRKSTRTINKYLGPEARLQRAQEKAKNFRLRRDEFEYKKMSPEQKKVQKQLQKQFQKKRFHRSAIKKNMLQGQQRIVRHRNFLTKAKDTVARVFRSVKMFFSLVSAIFTLLFIIAGVVFGGGFLLAICISYGGGAYLESTYQADYNQISDCSAYMRMLETDLQERISKIETEEYPDCYEYIYNLGEINHNSIELISYLAAKYVEFDLEKCQTEIESLFQEMYTLIIEIVEEPRERARRDEYGQFIYDSEGNPVMETFMAKICYITLEVKPLEDIISERLDIDEKKAFDTYMLSSGGQQVYANCLPDDWSNLISSKFGERIHPVTGERTFHNGIDIAVPEGTPLYSSCAGVVTTSAYSETAGNYIIVTMENGWSIKYMHLASRDVSAGTVILRGQYLGETGNTGRSTGAHLHLEVRDLNDNPIDPTFMIPSNSVIIE